MPYLDIAADRRSIRQPVILFAALGLLSLAVELNLWTLIDDAVAVWVQGQITPFRTALMLGLTELGSLTFAIPATTILGIVLAVRRSGYWLKRLCWTVPGCELFNELLKFLFHRGRPAPLHPLLQLETYSFPSGHAASATVFFGFLCILVCAYVDRDVWRWITIAATVALIAGVAFSRIYLGVHYFSDVTGGVINGLAWVSLTGAFMPADQTIQTDANQPRRRRL